MKRKGYRLISLASVAVAIGGTVIWVHDSYAVWRFTGSLHHPRFAPVVTLLADGRVLVTGGTQPFSDIEKEQPRALASAEVYDPVAGRWTETPPMKHPRCDHTATLLPDGTVLVCGGIDYYWRWGWATRPGTEDCEIYNPVTNLWSDAPPMKQARFGQMSWLLPKGDVLVAGGYKQDSIAFSDWKQPGYRAMDTTEIYDPKLKVWAKGPEMLEGQSLAGSYRFPDGTIVTVCGEKQFAQALDMISTDCASAEVYDTKVNRWSMLPDIPGGLNPPTYQAQLPDGSLFCSSLGQWMTFDLKAKSAPISDFQNDCGSFVQLPSGQIAEIECSETDSWLERKVEWYAPKVAAYIPVGMRINSDETCNIFSPPRHGVVLPLPMCHGLPSANWFY